ncbi:hypothetical protein LIA77_07049 [Sarocladium implicatum]|nr:hypothetical protein LIA77_07049 [Sarocladium implicatum]
MSRDAPLASTCSSRLRFLLIDFDPVCSASDALTASPGKSLQWPHCRLGALSKLSRFQLPMSRGQGDSADCQHRLTGRGEFRKAIWHLQRYPYARVPRRLPTGSEEETFPRDQQ